MDSALGRMHRLTPLKTLTGPCSEPSTVSGSLPLFQEWVLCIAAQWVLMFLVSMDKGKFSPRGFVSNEYGATAKEHHRWPEVTAAPRLPGGYLEV